MSVQPTTSDSSDYEADGETTFDRDAEAALDALPPRFNNFSEKYHNGDMIIVIPQHPFIDADGDECAHLIMSHEEDKVLEKGFTRGMVTHTRKGMGVAFWYQYEGPE